jgi:hypothetical protein
VGGKMKTKINIGKINNTYPCQSQQSSENKNTFPFYGSRLAGALRN